MTHNKKRKSVHGFTLLEMTIVVIIISILFLLSVPNIQKTLAIVNQKGCAAFVKFVADAVGVEFAVVAVVIDLCFRQLCECQNGKYQCDYSLCHQIA